MTIKELIEKLKTFDQDAKCYYEYSVPGEDEYDDDYEMLKEVYNVRKNYADRIMFEGKLI